MVSRYVEDSDARGLVEVKASVESPGALQSACLIRDFTIQVRLWVLVVDERRLYMTGRLFHGAGGHEMAHRIRWFIGIWDNARQSVETLISRQSIMRGPARR